MKTRTKKMIALTALAVCCAAFGVMPTLTFAVGAGGVVALFAVGMMEV